MLIEADLRTRNSCEEDVKESIKAGLFATRRALQEIARVLPADDDEQRLYAQCFLHANEQEESKPTSSPTARSARPLVFDTEDEAHVSSSEDGDRVLKGVAEAMSPFELRRVGDDFKAVDLDYTEQDIVKALGWVRTALLDMQTVLLELDDNDLEELSQMTLIGMRIAVRTAKGAHRTLSDMCGMPPRRPPVRLAVGATADTGAGPRATVVNLDAADLRHEPENDDTTGESGGRRILPWDPLTPRLVEGAQKLAAKGQERPLTAAAVVAAALPFSGLAVCVGAPVLACDAGLQWGASTPVGQAVGQCTQNALELGKLGWVAGKLVTKQSLRLARRELDRVGGPAGLTCSVAGGACWTATHPIEAAVMGVGLAGAASKAVYERALWVVDLMATVREEVSSS